MASDTKNLVLQIRRIVYSSIRLGYQSARDYPVVLGAGIVFLFLHELCPSVFTFILSSSPIFVLTALLLGAILSYGEPTVPLVGEETLENQETFSLKSNISITECSISEGGNNVTVEAHLQNRGEVFVQKRAADDYRHVVADTVPSGEVYVEEKRTSNDNTHDTHCQEKNVTFTADDTIVSADSIKYGKNNVIVGREEHAEEISEKAELQELESTYTSSGNYGVMHNQYQWGEFMRSCWQPVIRQDLPRSDSESDLTDDSSSPDASMTDIIPMLEELHPLIDLGTGHPSLASRDNLDSSSDDDEDDLEEEEDVSSDEEGTEGQEDGGDNWKDVTDLNYLDMKKNSKPDKLLEIQRTNSILRFELDKKLMDLQAADATQRLKEASSFHVQVPSISTLRQNPFDASQDSEETIELPQIPDSAPSVLHPRRNMFDLSFDRFVDCESRFQETWTPRSYLQARHHSKHRNSYRQQRSTYLQHHNGVKLESGEIDGEGACDCHSDNDAEQEGINDKLFGSLEAHIGEEIKILSAAISDIGVLEVNYGVDEGNKNANTSDIILSPVVKSVYSTSEAKDSVHEGDEQSILCSLPEENNSEPHVMEADSMSELNSLFKSRMEEVLVQSISEPSIGQPLRVKPEDELSILLSPDSGMCATEASSVEELGPWFAQLNEVALTCAASDSNRHSESSIRDRSSEALPAVAVNKHSSELPIEDGSSGLLATGDQQTADISQAISDSAVHDPTFEKLEGESNEPSTTNAGLPVPEARSAEDMNSLFKPLGEEAQLSNGDSKMSMSQDYEFEVEPVDLNSGLRVTDAETLGGKPDSGFKVIELKNCTEQAESTAAEDV